MMERGEVVLVAFVNADAEKIFDKFLQSSQGGRVWASAEPGRGSVFAFTLPAVAPTARAS